MGGRAWWHDLHGWQRHLATHSAHSSPCLCLCLCVQWMAAAIKMTSDLIETVQSSRGQVAGGGQQGKGEKIAKGGAAAAASGKPASGNRKKEKQRR